MSLMKNNQYYILFLILLISSIQSIQAQGLLDKLNKEVSDAPQYEIATFKSTRIALGQSVQVRKKNVLEFVVMNRFWDIPDSKIQSFLVDKLNSSFSLEYGASDRFTLGFGATTWDGVFNGFAKYSLYRQQKNTKKMPVSVTLFQNASYRSRDFFNVAKFDEFNDRFSFTTQLLIAKKITTNSSFQISPTFIHRNSSVFENDPENHFAIGFGGRRKIGKHTSLVSEYFYVANPLKSKETYNAFSIGVNWELSYIMLQFHFTNARTMEESAFITQTTNNFNSDDGKLHFGFNATFTLQLDKKKR